MRIVKILYMIFIIPICFLFNACDLNGLDSNMTNSAKTPDKDSKHIFNKLLEFLEDQEEKEILNLFTDKAKVKINKDNSINSLFDLYKGTNQTVNYAYSVENTIIENYESYKYDECLVFVNTEQNNYTFEFLISKNESLPKIVTLVVSTEHLRETPEYTEFILKTFNEATYLNKDYFGIYVIDDIFML